jgi:hypothetical protein
MVVHTYNPSWGRRLLTEFKASLGYIGTHKKGENKKLAENKNPKWCPQSLTSPERLISHSSITEWGVNVKVVAAGNCRQ